MAYFYPVRFNPGPFAERGRFYRVQNIAHRIPGKEWPDFFEIYRRHIFKLLFRARKELTRDSGCFSRIRAPLT
jgi:hypothetical protein